MRDAKPRGNKRAPRKKVCYFCERHEDNIDYIKIAKEIEKGFERPQDRTSEKPAERRPRFITEKGKIIPRRMSGMCVRHQRLLAQAIKRARVMALLPFQGE